MKTIKLGHVIKYFDVLCVKNRVKVIDIQIVIFTIVVYVVDPSVNSLLN
jgi:hypothetical protein